MDFFDILLAKKLKNDKDVSIVQLNVSENGTYSESGKAYSPVVVDVQPPSNSYLRTPIDSYPTTAEQLPIPKCDVEIANQKSCKVFVSNKPFVNDKVPYLFRKSAGGDRVYEKLIGGTIAWNQLVQNGNFADSSNWRVYNESRATLTINNNIAKVIYKTSASTELFVFGLLQQNIAVNRMHKILICFDILLNYDGSFGLDSFGNYNEISCKANVWSHFAIILNDNISSPNSYIVLRPLSNVTQDNYYQVKNVNIIDLTQMFGSTIADYIYSLEQATAGAGVAWFRQMFPSDYYAYDSGSLQSVNVASKKVYDSNNTLVATYTFDSDVTLRGLPKLDSNNNLYYDGDVYESDGTVTRRYGIVDLGSLTWQYSNSNRFSSTLPLAVHWAPNVVADALCGKYVTVSRDNVANIDKSLSVHGADNSYLNIHDSAYSDVSTFTTAMSGVYLVYELATPTTETADPYTNPQIVDADGTEEFVDYAYSQSTRDVAVPVGHDSLYYNGQLYQTDFAQAITDTINMVELHSIVPPSGEFYITSNGTLSVDVWKK